MQTAKLSLTSLLLIYTDYRDGVFSYLTAREQALCRRRAKVERLLAWKQKLDAEEREIERLEKEAVHGGVSSGRASSANDSTVSGYLWPRLLVMTSVEVCTLLSAFSFLSLGSIENRSHQSAGE